jgi:hypothetical protein
LPVRLVLATLLVFALAAPGAAQTETFARFLGGGPPATDCMLVTDVAGTGARRVARCTDGDPSCDADGVADGTCRFAVRVCLDAVDPNRPRCHGDVVTEVTATDAAISAALGELPMPVSLPDTCTTVVPVAVARKGARGRLAVALSAAMASGHRDRDHVVFVCRRPPPPPSFATIQRKILTPSCSTFSCHGAARAGGLALGDDALASLVGIPPSNATARAAGLLRVAPGDPDRSFLLKKLTADLTSGEGDPMPQVGSRLPPASIDLIRRWIVSLTP